MAARDAHATRAALLDAGLRLLGQLTATDLVAAMRTREIARRAGVSPPTFFHHFPTVEDYAQALVEHVYDAERASVRGRVTGSLRDVRRLTLPAEQTIAYHTNDLLQLAAHPEYRVRLGLWALGGPAADEAHTRYLDAIDEQLMPQAQALHDLWGREVRPPLDLRSSLAIQVALLTGAAMRHLAQPTVLTPERYARGAAALSMVLLRPRGERRTMDDRLSEMNYAPGPRDVVPRVSGERDEVGRRELTRASLIDAAAELFGEYGYEAASVDRLARTAGVHVATLYEHFESKAHLALALLDRQAAAHLEAHSVPPADQPRGRLRDHLESVATFAAHHTDLAGLYVGMVARGDPPAALDDVLRRSTARLVAAVVTAEAEVDRATEHVLVTAIGAMLRHPGDGPATAAEAALRFLPAAGEA